MNTNKVLVFLSTHVINRAVISEYRKLTNVSGCDCILAIDNTHLRIPCESPVIEKEFYNTPVRCFFFDQNIHNELNLPWFIENRETGNFSEIMWYNCDYRFYYVRKYFPEYDYYWQFEYDIFCNGDSYQTFFNTYSKRTENLLILDFREERLNGSWWWSKKVDWEYKENPVYGSLFPIVRLTGNAIDFLYRQRLQQKARYHAIQDKTNSNWPFSELFVPTELVLHGFTAFNMVEKQITWDKEYDLNEVRLFEHPDNLLYHPVKGQFLERERKLKKEKSAVEKDLAKVKAEKAAIQKELATLHNKNRKILQQLSQKEQEVLSLKNSRSYKLGKFLTLPLRAVKKLFKQL